MKKNIFFLLCILFHISSVNANTWQEYWIKAIKNCDQKDYASAINMFDLAIEYMEKEGDAEHPYVYVDRARLNLLLERNELVIPDLDKALANEKITKKEKSRAIVSRMIARSRLGMDEGVLEDLKFFAETAENRPIIEKTKESIIIRNVPDCSCYRKLMTCYFIHSGICESKNDIQMLKSGIWLIRRKCDCGCEKSNANIQNRTCDECGAIIEVENTQEKIDSCKRWCDRMAIAGAGWCGKAFKRLDCQTACACAVYEIQQGCYWCCQGEGFYKRCIKPFEDIGSYMKTYIQEPCDPFWD